MRAFRIAYDGTPFYGFQRQPDVPTVEDALLDALRALDVLDAGTPPGYAAAGRTNAGVSARAQTVAFDAPEWLTPRALNGELPAAVRAWAQADAPPEFHATHDAATREYVYHLHAPRAAVDDGRIADAAVALSGTHDLHNLTPDDRNTERTLSVEAERDGDYLVVTVRAGGFPRELVRRLVSLLDGVGRGTEPPGKVERVLAADPLPGHEGIGPAPPEPLVLADVDYPDLAFRTDEEAAGSARGVFGDLRVERRTGARVAGDLADGL